MEAQLLLIFVAFHPSTKEVDTLKDCLESLPSNICYGVVCNDYKTGEPVDEWGCAVTWMPFMAVEISQKSNQTGAAVESFRNEVVRANQENQKLYKEALEQQIIPARIMPLNQPINMLEEGKEE